MKYCLSSRQSNKYLTMTDEIFVKSNDYRHISDLFVDYPDKMVILEIDNDKVNDMEFLSAVEQYGKASENFCCCIYDLRERFWFQEREIKFYYGYPISTYYDMRGLMELGVEYIKITAPLTHDIETLKKCDMKFRVVPNVAYDAYVPRINGICGQWIRPEDIGYYEDAIYVFEFEDANLEKERTLYDIYNKGIWNGNLNLLITNLNVDADNRALPEDLGEVRSVCRQRCMVNGICHFCETAFSFEHAIRKYKLEKALEATTKD